MDRLPQKQGVTHIEGRYWLHDVACIAMIGTVPSGVTTDAQRAYRSGRILESQGRETQRVNPMGHDQKLLKTVVGRALSGKGAHVASLRAFSGVDAQAAGAQPLGLPHSLFQILSHIVFWQDWVVKWLDGEKPRVPKHASGSWPASPAPANATEWRRSMRRFQTGLGELERRSREVDLLAGIGKQSRLEMLHALASHTSYHIGQAVVLRQILRKWPPPSGGLTW